MSSINKAIIVGRLGNDPETRYLPKGDAVTSISVATSESWKDKQTGQKQEKTEWHRISMFGKLAEIAGEYLRKGSMVYIEGSIVTRKWKDKDGQDRHSTEIKAHTMKMLDSRSTADAQPLPKHDGMQAEASRQQGQHDKPEADNFDDSIPF